MTATPKQLGMILGEHIGTIGQCLGALNALALALDGMQNPKYRWGAWALAGLLSSIASVRCKDQKSPIALPDEESLVMRDPQRKAFTRSAIIFFALLVGDVLYITIRSPVEWTPITSVEGLYPDFETADPFSLAAVDDVVTPETESLAWGINATSFLMRRSGIDHLLIRELAVEVVRFAEMPIVKSTHAGLEELDSVDATFVLEKKGSDFPWTFSPTELRLNEDLLERLPLRLTDSAPVALSYWIKSRDPGIYWVRCVAWVSNGISPPQRIELTPEPIPLGYFEADVGRRTLPVDGLAPKFEALPPQPLTE